MRVLIVGLGSIAKKHMEALKKLDKNIQIFGLRHSKNSNRVEGVQNIYDIGDVEKYDFDFAIVANPTGEHLNTITQLKEFRIPLFIEKPLFSNIDDTSAEIVKSFEDLDIRTYVACNLRFLDCISYIKNELLSELRINEVNVYCGSYLPDWRKDVDFRTIYSANKEMGGGVQLDLIHELDYVYWLFGIPNETQAFFSNNSSLNITATDYANYTWTYPSFSANIILNYYRPTPKRQLEILTQTDVWLVDLIENKIYKNDALYFHSERNIQDTYTSQMLFFIEQILKNNKKFNSISEAFDVLTLCTSN
ncbi:MAG: Gfo/Idh/MocA family oxidoreductase [Flavobacterium sp.]|nr:MAG: Gfo/Idh/MocA family oxidoreductase [Flavobacterium sp.]